jgi:phage FluMu gp28-like protein
MNRPPFVAQNFPGKCKIFPERDVMLLPFQTRWVLDNSQKKLAVKSRQIGFSWTTAYRVVRQKLRKGARLDAWVASRDEAQAQLFLQDAKRFASILDVAGADLGQTLTGDDGHTTYELRFSNGLRVHSMSSNADAQAGKRGDRVLDEFALHPDPRKLYSISYPGITWGGCLEIFSTHRGSGNYFNELIREIRERGNPKGFSFHSVTLQNALDEGLLYKLQCKLPEDDPRMQMDESDYFNFIRSGCADEEGFQQEFCCQPADDASAFLTYDLIASCEYPIGVSWETDLEDTKNPLFVGVDVGRDKDLTVIWVTEKIADVHFTRRVIELARTPFDEQERQLYEILALPSVRRCCIDQTGIGRQFAERAQKRFGAYKVEGVHFTPAVKEELAYPVKAAFEDKTIKIPMTNAIRHDLRGIRKEVTASGNIRFAGESSKYGHCDRLWSLGLALHGAKTLPSGALTSTAGIFFGSTKIGPPRRTFTPSRLRYK